MGYYMRFIVTDDRPVALTDVRTAYCEAGAGAGGYCLELGGATARVCHEGTPIAHVTINGPGDGGFDEARAELVAEIERVSGRGRDRVLEALRDARQIVVVEALFGDDGVEETLAHVDHLWWWLFTNRDGLAQADGEGYYEFDRRILTVR